MSEFIRHFSQIIINDREWSWSVIGILYMGITLILRAWFMRPVTRRVKELKKAWMRSVKEAYLRRAFMGWVLYFLGFIVVLYIWSRPHVLPLTIRQALGLVGALAAYILSIVLHIQALGVAAMETLKQIEGDNS